MFTIKEESTVPIHRQLEEQVKQLIWNGQLSPSTRLPSVRELAGFLRINRNTVARAYEELEREGFVASHGARGTFVVERPPLQRRQAELTAFLVETLAHATDLGLTPEECAVQLLAFAQANPNTHKTRRTGQRILLLECNIPQLEQFRGELEKALPLGVDTMLLDELSRGPRPHFEDYRVVVTTFFHADEVRPHLVGTGVELVTLLLQDNLPTLLRLRALLRGTRAALVCESEHGLQNFRKSMHDAGLEERLQIYGALLSQPVSVEQALENAQVVICSSRVVEEQIRSKVRQGVEIITDDRSLDSQGIELLRRRLLNVKAGD
jgi:GntR family transcriptional regulator